MHTVISFFLFAASAFLVWIEIAGSSPLTPLSDRVVNGLGYGLAPLLISVPMAWAMNRRHKMRGEPSRLLPTMNKVWGVLLLLLVAGYVAKLP